MDTRNTLEARVRARGAVKPVMLAVIAVIVVMIAAAWFLIIQPHQEIVMADAGGHPSTPVTPGTTAAPPPPANVEAMGSEQLLSEARKAMNEQRYLAPAGNNAFEFYLRALEKDPGNEVATDALRETFPFAASSAEQAINARNFNEAQREIDLLAKADPANYTLTILRSKLDAQRKLLDKEQQQVLDEQQRQQQLAQQRAAAEKDATEKLAAEQAAAADDKKPASVAQQAAAVPKPAQPAAQQPVVPKPAAPALTAAVLVKSVNPRYPTQAQRSRVEGYVVVSFTVEPDGSTSNIRVTDAQPRHVFERAATDAVERWQFTPATRGGVPVASVLSNRINFRL